MTCDRHRDEHCIWCRAEAAQRRADAAKARWRALPPGGRLMRIGASMLPASFLGLLIVTDEVVKPVGTFILLNGGLLVLGVGRRCVWLLARWYTAISMNIRTLRAHGRIVW